MSIIDASSGFGSCHLSLISGLIIYGAGSPGHTDAKNKEINLETNLIPHKINSERHMGINVKYKIIKFLEDNVGENLGNLMYGNDFLNIKPEM